MLRWLLVLVCLVAAPEAAADEFTSGQQNYRAALYDKAYELWLPAAQGGDMRAQYSVGVLHERGQAVPKDIVAAARWYALSAAQGYEPAATALRSLAPRLQELFDAKKATVGTEKDSGPPPPKQKPALRASHADAEGAGAAPARRDRS